MTLNVVGLVAAVTSKAQALGLFDAVAGHEPENAPGNGLTCAVWVADLRPIPRRSGLAAVSARLTLSLRIYRNAPAAGSEAADDLDPATVAAADALIGALIGDFDLGESVEIDVFGAHGAALTAKSGWLKPDEGPAFRVIDVTVPIIVDDLWPQAR